MLDGVVHHIEQCPPQQRCVADKLRVVHGVQRQPNAATLGQRPGSPRHIAQQVVQIERFRAQWLPCTIGAGEEEEIFHQRRETFAFALDNAQRVAVFRAGAIGQTQGDVGLIADDCQRRTEFVRSVGHELALGAKGLLQTLQQVVDHAGQRPQIIVGIRDRNAGREVGRTDGRRLSADVGDGGQRSARQCIPSRHSRQQRHQHQRKEGQPHVAQHRAVVRSVVGGDDHCTRPVGEAHPMEEHPDADASAGHRENFDRIGRSQP